MKRSFIVFCACLLMGCLLPLAGYGAYHHEGEDDSGNFLTVYPQKAHTKLDSCALCHKGGEYGGKNYGSCQYCHAVYNLTGTEHGSFQDTLNGYGLAYQQATSRRSLPTATPGTRTTIPPRCPRLRGSTPGRSSRPWPSTPSSCS